MSSSDLEWAIYELQDAVEELKKAAKTGKSRLKQKDADKIADSCEDAIQTYRKDVRETTAFQQISGEPTKTLARIFSGVSTLGLSEVLGIFKKD